MWTSCLVAFVFVFVGDAALQGRIDFAHPELPFMGIGGLSGGGGTSRLLYDYPEPQRSDVLDALFLPQKGASVQILKVEIGGDAQSTEAVEASHMHTRDDGALDCEACYNRGYEWWLLREAKKRNSGIKTYGLSWGVPGWIGNGSFYSQDNIDYHLRWMLGLKKYHGIQLDYMGIWNERDYNRDWVVQLRHALDAEASGVGQKVQIVAADTNWGICDDMASNSTLRDAVAIVGVHYPITKSTGNSPAPQSCLNLGKPLWTSEGWNLGKRNDYDGALNLAATLNKNWIESRQQAMIIWTVIYSWYSILPFSNPDGHTVGGMGHGLMSACEPWSGHYRVMPPVYVVAHHTQFARADGSCSYIDNAAVATNGYLGASTIVAYRCASHSASASTDFDVSIVIESSEAKESQTIRLQLEHLAGISMLRVWQTNETQWFQRGQDMPVGDDGSIEFILAPRSIVTLTTTAGQGRVSDKTIPKSAVFPLPYSDNFDSYSDQATVKYFTDEGGSWNAAPAPGRSGMSLMQVVNQYPIAWEKNPDPFTLMGDSQSSEWADYTVSVDALEGNITVPPGSSEAVYDLTLYKCGSDEGPQLFEFDAKTDHLRLLSNSSLCIGLSGHPQKFAGSDDVKVVFCSAADNRQQWVRKGLAFVNAHNQNCLDAMGGSTSDGTDVFSYTCTAGKANQNWNIDVDGHVSSAQTATACVTASKIKPSIKSSAFIKLCGRIHNYARNGAPVHGYCLVHSVKQQTWTLLASGKTLANGTIASELGVWHSLALRFKGSAISASIDGKNLVALEDTTFPVGMVAVGSGWHRAWFDNFAIALPGLNGYTIV